MLSGELESLRSELDSLTDLSGQLVSVSGQQETSKLDQVISDLTADWQLTADQCKVQLQQVDGALQLTHVFNEQLMVCTTLFVIHHHCRRREKFVKRLRGIKYRIKNVSTA